MKAETGYTLDDYQKLIKQLVIERGFEEEKVEEVFLLLIEEVGEFAKATRKHKGMKVGKHSVGHDLSEEAADVFWLLIDLCNRLDINLADAFAAKEVKNSKRKWASN